MEPLRPQPALGWPLTPGARECDIWRAPKHPMLRQRRPSCYRQPPVVIPLDRPASRPLHLSACLRRAPFRPRFTRPRLPRRRRSKIPPPAVDAQRAPGLEKAVFAGGCFWGVQGVFQHVEGRDERRLGLCRRRRRTRPPTSMVGTGTHRPCRGGRGHLRPGRGQLRRAAAGVLLGRPQPDPAELPGAGPRHAVPLGDLPVRRRAGRGRQGLHRPARRGRRSSAADRHHARSAARPSTRPRTTTRTS